MDGERLLLTVREASRLLGLSERRLYALIAEKALPEGVVVRLGRAIRLSAPRLRRWLGVDASWGGVEPETPTADGTNGVVTSEQLLRGSLADDGD
jgi:excisionase family DNA binding protein